jgi:hypothetical protein
MKIRLSGTNHLEKAVSDERSYEIRAMTAGVFLARHLLRCIEARAQDVEPPEPASDDLSGDAGIQHVLDFSATILGITAAPGYEARLLRFYQALAEMISLQGAELECMMHATLHDNDERQAYVMRVKVKEGSE